MKKSRRLCLQCRKRAALFWRRKWRKGRVKFDKDHELCPQCHRALADATRHQKGAI